MAAYGSTARALRISPERHPGPDLRTYMAPGRNLSRALAAAIGDAHREAERRNRRVSQPVRVVVRMPRGRLTLTEPVVLQHIRDVELAGTGTLLVNTTRSACFTISECEHLVFTDFAIDYDPLPFTQGVVTAVSADGLTVDLEVDTGYPWDEPLLRALAGGWFTVFDRQAMAPAVGVRHFITPRQVTTTAPGMLRVALQWSVFDCGSGQEPVRTGDVVALKAHMPSAIHIHQSSRICFQRFHLQASPGFGINVVGGKGANVLDRVRVAPGPKPHGARHDRLCSTNSDGTHFNSVEIGPTITGCEYRLTTDDPINIHGFYHYIVARTDDRQYTVSTKWGIGLEVGDTIETTRATTFESLGPNRVVFLRTRQAPELQTTIDRVWSGRSPTTRGAEVVDVTLERPVRLEIGDAISSVTRLGNGAVIRNCLFHGGGRVMVKAHNVCVERNRFCHSVLTALHIGSDIGYWSEAGFARQITVRHNRFTHCARSGNNFFDGTDVCAALMVGLTYPNDYPGLAPCRENRDILIEDNVIDRSFGYAIQLMHASGMLVQRNRIGACFVRDSTFGVGRRFGIQPDSAILAVKLHRARFTDNRISLGGLVRRAIMIHPSCTDIETA